MKETKTISIGKILSNLIASIIVIIVGASLLRSISNRLHEHRHRRTIKPQRGMLANIMGGFIAVLVGVSLMGTIGQEINNAFCGSNETSSLFSISTGDSDSSPNGATDSFGGGGAEHFGGYTGKVEHKNWFGNLAPIKTNKSMFFSGDSCIDPNSA